MQKFYSPDFAHYKQSVRVVEILEDMNLCYETVDGILTHSWGYKPNTPEAQVVQYADKIAYINYDSKSTYNRVYYIST